MTSTKCNNLILFSEQKGYEEATVSLTSGAKMMKNIKNNYRLIHFDVALSNKHWEKLNIFFLKT